MQANDRKAFQGLLADAMAFYRQDVSPFALSVWWQACQAFSLEQVTKALTAHAMDPERGQFAPKPADLVRLLQGTRTDRALLAWGKVLDAIQRVGAYSSVAFDDGVIHAVIEDLGGWVAVCRSEIGDLPFVERRFCESYRAYAMRGGEVAFPASLPGAHAATNSLQGYGNTAPVLIGDAAKAQRVLAVGLNKAKTQFTHPADHVVAALRLEQGRAA